MAKQKFMVLSPDGFSISMDGEYASKKAAEVALDKFVKRFEHQGYYSTSNRERIPLDEIKNHCRTIAL